MKHCFEKKWNCFDFLQEKQSELPDKEEKINRIEKEASVFLKSGKIPDTVKQGVRMDIQELRTRLQKVIFEIFLK